MRSFFAIIFLTVCFSAFAEPLKVVNVLSLTQQDLNKILEEEHSDLTIEFSANTFLPLHLFLRGDLISLIEIEDHSLHLEVKQTFYVRFIQKELFFSLNLTEWKSFSEFVTGIASVALGSKDGQAFISIGAETILRGV